MINLILKSLRKYFLNLKYFLEKTKSFRFHCGCYMTTTPFLNLYYQAFFHSLVCGLYYRLSHICSKCCCCWCLVLFALIFHMTSLKQQSQEVHLLISNSLRLEKFPKHPQSRQLTGKPL